MKTKSLKYIEQLCQRYPELKPCRDDVICALALLMNCFDNGGKLMTCGNGGSAADSQHIVGELMKGFMLPRLLGHEYRRAFSDANADDTEYLMNHLQGALPALSLVGENALLTAYANDQAPDLAFAQQVLGLGKPGDVLLGISTSGNSPNVLFAAECARVIGAKIIGLAGCDGGKLKGKCDVCICVPAMETFKVQEYHLPIYHAICQALEEEFFGEEA